MNDSYYENEIDWMTMCMEMTNTIDALNTNLILLNRFIDSAIELSDCSMNFKGNIEITSFDTSGNIMTCVKSDGSGNFVPCAFIDLSYNMLPCVLPPDISGNKTNRERCFSPYSPYYYPYYDLYYNILLKSLDDDDTLDRAIPSKKSLDKEYSYHYPHYPHYPYRYPHYPHYPRYPHYPYYYPPFFHPIYYPGNQYPGNQYPGNQYNKHSL